MGKKREGRLENFQSWRRKKILGVFNFETRGPKEANKVGEKKVFKTREAEEESREVCVCFIRWSKQWLDYLLFFHLWICRLVP